MRIYCFCLCRRYYCVTVQEDSSNGVYSDIASFTIDKGEHWNNSSLANKYLHVTADKPVSALTSYDQSYFVPSADGLWTGTEFYTYANDIGAWPEDLTVIAYDDNTAVNIKDSDSHVTIWSGTLDSGQAHVEQYPNGADKYFTITTDKTAAVSVQPWKSMTSNYLQGVFVPDRDGTGIGMDLIGSTQTGGYLNILAYTDGTNVNLYNSETNVWQASYTLDMGEMVNANPGNGLWRITSDEAVSVYSGWGSNPIANFVPLAFNQYLISLTKVDDVNDLDCVGPGNDITYTICWEMPDDLTLEDAEIVDYLPEGVTCPSGYWSTDPNTGMPCWIDDLGYDPNTHTYTWDLGTIEPDDANCVSLTVKVNERAVPGMLLHNVAELVSGGVVWAHAYEETLVCCWDTVDPNIIYVDKEASGSNNGTSWDDAYVDLQDGFYRAANSNCAVGGFSVHVAQGTYSPGYDAADTFGIPDGTKVIGGYKTGGGDWNPDRYETILTGVADPNSVNNDAVVTMGADTLLGGFTVTGSADYGVYGDGSDFSIRNCKIESNEEYGVYALDGNVTIAWCSVTNNGFSGIEHAGESNTLTVENSQIKQNDQHGIFTDGSIPTVKNSIISSNAASGDIYYGIRIINPADDPTLHNNTIVYNAIEGISLVDNEDSGGDPNDKDWPDIQNCIVYFNNDGGSQMAGMVSDDVASYSCIQDCNNLNNNINVAPGFAYTIDPNGIMPDPNNLHLAYDSVCIDAENPNLITDPDAMDFDGEDREYGSSVDIGADEVYSCDEPLSEDDVYNPLDWNADGILNYEEFEYFSLAWLSHDPEDPAASDPNDPAYDPDLGDPNEWDARCNLDSSGTSQYEIDLADLAEFIDNGSWLWTACWKQSRMDRYEDMAEAMEMGGSESMMMPMSMESFAVGAVESEPESADLTEEQLVKLVKGIYSIMSSLDESFQTDDLTQEEVDRFIDFFGAILLDLKEEYLE